MAVHRGQVRLPICELGWKSLGVLFGHVKQASQVASRVRWQGLLPKLYLSHSQSPGLQRRATVRVETDNRERPVAVEPL